MCSASAVSAVPSAARIAGFAMIPSGPAASRGTGAPAAHRHVDPADGLAVDLAAPDRLPHGDTLSFTRPQDMIGLTPGNLITHLRKLEDAGYVDTEKTGSGTSAQTTIALTHDGRAALDRYTTVLRQLLDTAGQHSSGNRHLPDQRPMKVTIYSLSTSPPVPGPTSTERLSPGAGGLRVPAPGSAASLVTLADLETDPHPVLARLRAAAPVSWVPVLGAWLVTGYDLATAVLRDARTFTVDDPRFSTAKVVGPSMLSLDGASHARHRGPFNRAFRHDEVHARLALFTRAETGRLVSAIEPHGSAELRRAVAGPLAVTVMAQVLGLGQADPARVLAWYDGIVAAVQAEAATAQGRPATQVRPGPRRSPSSPPACAR